MKAINITIFMIVTAGLFMFLSGCEEKEEPPLAKEIKAAKEAVVDANVFEEKQATEVIEEMTAPDFTLENYDGNSVSLADYMGKVVVLEWINYDCPFSKYHHEKANTMKDLAKKYKEQGVVWLAINSTDYMTADKNREFAAANGITYPILDDRDGKTGKAYGAKTTPHMYIINTECMIVYNGAIDNSPMGKNEEGVVNYVDKALSEMAEGKAVSDTATKPYGCSVKYDE